MKYLISGGCSFTTTCFTVNWPIFLAEKLNYTLEDTAVSSQGNSQIARQIVHKVTQLLKDGVKSSDMLVGIVWSGTDRTEFFLDKVDPNVRFDPPFPACETTPVVNVGTGDDGGWRIVQPVFDSKYTEEYVEKYHNRIGGVIKTYESIHWVQTFLKFHNIKYFMSTYTDEVFGHGYDNNPNVAWIKDAIDYSKFLPVSSYYRYTHNEPVGPEHPTPEQSKDFVEQVIYPFIQKNYKI